MKVCILCNIFILDFYTFLPILKFVTTPTAKEPLEIFRPVERGLIGRSTSAVPERAANGYLMTMHNIEGSRRGQQSLTKGGVWHHKASAAPNSTDATLRYELIGL